MLAGAGCRGAGQEPEPIPLDVAAPTDPAHARLVLESRCVVCHGCYDAPCQLNLASRDGLLRGATKQPVYQPSRLFEAPLTRLFEDAETQAQWREKGFHPVVSEASGQVADALALRMLALGHAAPFAPHTRLSGQLDLDINRPLHCPTDSEFARYAAANPMGGMPYGTAPLSPDELETLSRWIAQKAPDWEAVQVPAAVARQVEDWEAFLNGPSLRERLVARYLFEHWFLAHLTFEDAPLGPYFEIVRSSAPPGEPVQVLPTRRPFDDPGAAPFWYRLRPIQATILHKTHIVYPVGPDRMQRLRELFFEPDWDVAELPGYELEKASNPFVTFAAIPAGARYQYLLDDARYFVMTFIRGPVCRGQVAVNVIRDRFWVAFLDPEYDLSVADPTLLARAKGMLDLPAEIGSGSARLDIVIRHDRKQEEYLKLREESYDALDPTLEGPTLAAIWDGDGHDRDALLTVFRHFDNATVVRGFHGRSPQTAWLLDYPLFERIYYALVAGFDVFGNVTHQAATRLYMDHLRMQAEDLLLQFLPADHRDRIFESWYEGAERQLSIYRTRDRVAVHDTQVAFTKDDLVADLLDQVELRVAAVAGPPDLLNRCAEPPCMRVGASNLERTAEGALATLSGVRGPFVATLPQLTYVRVRAAASGESRLYTLVHESAHRNVAYLFGEEDWRVPERDTITVMRGLLGSYPNFLFNVPEPEVLRFAEVLRGVRDPAGLTAVVERWGVRRTSPRFWENMDWLRGALARQNPVEAGLLDLNRYRDL